MKKYELLNPFTPSSIASNPEEFYGREDEIRTLDRIIRQGSLIIQGPTGIGKSSLLSRVLLHMEGFSSDNNSKIIICVAHSDIKSVDDAARLLLEELCLIDSKANKLTIDLPKFVSYESERAYSYFNEGRYLSSLFKIIEDKQFQEIINNSNFIVFAIDECDKCPAPIARLIRQILNKTQLNGIKNIRFILSGVSPFYDNLIKEDPGINRFIYKSINLGKLHEDEAKLLIDNKFAMVVADAKENELKLEIDEKMLERIYSLASGHPHLLQLLGSCVIEHENENPNGVIDTFDLLNSLREICYVTRASIYDLIIHTLECHDHLNSFKEFIDLSEYKIPTVVDKVKAQQYIDAESLIWLIKNSIITENNDYQYELVDEFLRVRIMLDEDDGDIVSKRIMKLADAELRNRVDDDMTYEEMMESRYYNTADIYSILYGEEDD
jgi:hypothetical protein